MAKRFGNCWVSRDKNNGNYYNVSVGRRPQIQGPADNKEEIIWEGTGLVEWTPRQFHKLCSIRLKPGEGPCRMAMTMIL